MNLKLLMDIAMLTGEIMLKSGAETYRVEDTMCRILQISQLERTEAFVTTTGIMATLDDASMNPISVIRRVDKRNTNLNAIYLANDISRKLCIHEIGLEEAYQELKSIQKIVQYPDHLLWIATIVTSASFTLVLGGGIMDSVVSAINGLLIVIFRMLTKKKEVHVFIVNMMISIFIAIHTMLYMNLSVISDTMDVIIVGSIMPMLPGVAITNAIRDTLQGDYMSGMARGLEAFLIAFSIAVGIGVGLALSSIRIGGMFL